MDRPRVVRLLRIGWSAACVLACLLLIALWGRSYWSFGQIVGPAWEDNYFLYQSLQGRALFEITHDPNIEAFFGREWTWTTLELRSFATYHLSAASTFSQVRVVVPYWLLVVSVSMLATAPWFRWRFGLRTLLIATTLVAIVLGLIVRTFA
jgi:hypothetical protein